MTLRPSSASWRPSLAGALSSPLTFLHRCWRLPERMHSNSFLTSVCIMQKGLISRLSSRIWMMASSFRPFRYNMDDSAMAHETSVPDMAAWPKEINSGDRNKRHGKALSPGDGMAAHANR